MFSKHFFLKLFELLQRYAPFYNLKKPLVIGEFSRAASLTFIPGSGIVSRTIEALFAHAYDHGYAGAWSWHAAVSTCI